MNSINQKQSIFKEKANQVIRESVKEEFGYASPNDLLLLQFVCKEILKVSKYRIVVKYTQEPVEFSLFFWDKDGKRITVNPKEKILGFILSKLETPNGVLSFQDKTVPEPEDSLSS